VRVLDTIVKQPTEQKFRSVSIEKTKAKLANVKGAVAYLTAAGFKTTTTHYELAMGADLAVIKAYLTALNEYNTKNPASPPAPVAASAPAKSAAGEPAPKPKLVVQAFKASVTKEQEEDETAKAIADIERKKKERKRLEELRKKDKAADYKPVCSSNANQLHFGATKGVLPPPKKSA